MTRVGSGQKLSRARIEVSSDKRLIEVRRMLKGNLGRLGENIASQGI